MKKYLSLCLFFLASIVFAQDVPFSYILPVDGGLTYYGAEREIIVSDGSVYNLSIGWNPSGRYFMNVLPDFEGGNNVILLNDLSVPESFPMISDIEPYSGHLFFFGDDSVLFAEYTPELLISEDEQGLGIIVMNLYQWDFEENQSAVTPIGGIPFGVGCGGGAFRNALDTVYNEEAHGDTYGQYNQKILAPTPYGIVHSNSCTAIRTLLTQPDTMESIELGDKLQWATVAPDGNYVIGTSANDLLLINLDTKEESIIFAADAPIIDSIWSADSQHIYFVARTHTGDSLTLDDPDDVLANVDPFDIEPQVDDALIWQSTLYAYDTATGELSNLYTAEAYALANLTLVGDSLYFSQIETPAAWLQAYINNPETADSDMIERRYWLFSLGDNQLTELEGDFAGAFIQPQ